MTNHRLLAGLMLSALLSGGVFAQDRVTVTLEQVFEAAESGSVQLRRQAAAVSEAARGVEEARAGMLPDINATLNLSYIGDGFTTARNFSDYQKAPIPHLGTGLTIGVTQPVYTGGALTTGVEMAQLKTTAARYAEELSRDDLRFRLTGYYLDIYKYDSLREVVESNLQAARKVLAEMHARYEQGTALRNDITRYELLVANLELELVRIANTRAILNRNLVTTAGFPAGTDIAPDTTILSRALPRGGEASWQQEALQSPSLRMASTALDLTLSAEKMARAERLPHIGLQAGWNIDGPILVEVPPINRNLSYWFVGVGVSWNISSLYKTNRTLSRARAATLRARDELDEARQNTSLAVADAHVRYLEAYEVLASRSKSVELATRNYATTSTRYAEGMALITDMLDAANSRLAAGQSLVDARIDIIYYYYKLLFISGTI